MTLPHHSVARQSYGGHQATSVGDAWPSDIGFIVTYTRKSPPETNVSPQRDEHPPALPLPASVGHDAGVRARAWASVLAAGIAVLAPQARGDSAGDLTGNEPLADHAEEVASYTLYAALDPATHVVRAAGTIRWRNASRLPARELWVHLYMNAFKNAHSAFLRERGIGGRGTGLPRDFGSIEVQELTLLDGLGNTPVPLWSGAEFSRAGDDDETDARVPLPRAVAPGEIIELRVVFEDKLPSITLRTGYEGTFHMVGQWFPKVARLEPDGTWRHFEFHHLSEFYADFGTYDVTLDVPASFLVGATGPVLSERVEGGRRIERHRQTDVHDFAWAAWDAFRSLRERVYGIDVLLLHPAGFESTARRELAALRFALPYFSRRYGPYPYTTLTVVTPQEDAGEAGGMEYPTLITTGGPWVEPAGLLSTEIVTVHELAHQWFQGLVATDEAAWPFLDEGLTEYSEADAMDRWRGAASCIDGWPFVDLTVSDSALLAEMANRAPVDEPIAQPATSFSTGANYADLVYARTSTILETLARVYGDEAVSTALGQYARHNRFEHPEPSELLESFERVMGTPVARTLRAALFEKGWVDYLVESVTSTEASRFDSGDGAFSGRPLAASVAENRWNSSALVRRRGTLSFPVDIAFIMSDGTIRRDRWDGDGDWKRFRVSGPSRVREAIVDPDDRVLLDADPSNNRAAAQGTAGGAPRTIEWATYFMQLALQTVVP